MYTRHTSSCRCVGCTHSPQSRTCVRSRGFVPLPPSCNSNYLGYKTRGIIRLINFAAQEFKKCLRTV
ncbi:hypothetical protein CIW55_06945 [Enterobacter cloacae]|uniref:Uncharacterized protein n=1 Tax=Enterobacter cloacae TaxID=550 RepID=A0AB37VK11_ENTCL|nr:hypothetical protein CIW55_06945 [Enterobacter cloacae]QFQ08676.1 hypothetical protein C1N69_08205 [Enterobacter sichuanensis]PAN78904.1 hypothetical protein CIW69_06305 [Enterobacter cloacae]PAO05404.1 hypothetical protein CIW61_08625 [Enterobacter cloacae]PAO15706.1 hypothetical protein CIW58_07455 [Enterobacter cloacae]